MSEEPKRLYRSQTDRMIAGVCGGLGDFFKLDPTVVRVLTVLLTLVWPFTILAYLVLMFVVPEAPLLETLVSEESPAVEQSEIVD